MKVPGASVRTLFLLAAATRRWHYRGRGLRTSPGLHEANERFYGGTFCWMHPEAWQQRV